MKFHPDVLAAHTEFGGDLEAMQALYDRPDHLARIAELAAENERLKIEIGECKLVIEQQDRDAEALSRTGAEKVELSGNTGELIDKMAEAIRGDTASDDTPWATLSEDRKIGWRGDAERALAVVKEYLTARRPSEQAELAEAQQRYVDANEARIDAEAQLAEARKALEPFALVAEHDIGEDESDNDLFRPMPKPFNHAPQITVGHLRAALAVVRGAK